MVGKIFEGMWIAVKTAIVILILTIIFGTYFMLISITRGSIKDREETSSYVPVSQIKTNMDKTEKQVEEWFDEVTKEKITMVADDKKQLIAMKIINENKSDKWAVVLHGYDSDKRDVYDIALRYYDKGFNILVPDLRAHGESEGTFIGMGWLERLDVINWIDVILKEEMSAQIVIHGVGMGGATALMMAGEPLKSNIKAIISDGSYTSAWDICKSEYKVRNNFPVFPFLHMTLPITKLVARYDLKEASALEQVKKAQQPILFIHGAKDDYVDVKMLDELYDAAAGGKDKCIISDGGRADARYAQPDVYYNAVFQFIDTYVK